jgi:hypothetical protein
VNGGDITSPHGLSTAVCNNEGEERFLFLYLSLMLAIFSIVTLLQISNPAVLSSPSQEEPGERGDDTVGPPLETLHGDEQVAVGETSLVLFQEGSASLDENAVAALLFLLRSHDLNATISLVGARERPSLAYARALTLQQRLEQHSLSARDVRVEVHFSQEPQDESLLALVRF